MAHLILLFMLIHPVFHQAVHGSHVSIHYQHILVLGQR